MASYSEVKVSNNSKGTLAGGVSANQGTLSLLGGEGSKFPTVTNGEYFYITVTSSALSTNTEIMRVTDRIADTLTVKQANGSARNLNNTFSAGDSVELRTTANAVNDLFDLENVLPDVPTQPDRFQFRSTTPSFTTTKYIGPNGVVTTGGLPSSVGGRDRDIKFAIKSDGTNATYTALNPADISDDNNTSTGFLSIPVRGHYDLSHMRGTTFARYLNASTSVNASGGYAMSTVIADKYGNAEGHDIAIQEGSLVYLANVSDNNDEYGAYGEWATAEVIGAVSASQTLIINNVRRLLNMNPRGGGPGSFLTFDGSESAEDYIGKFVFPPAVGASLVNVPPGTHVTGCQKTAGPPSGNVTLTLNNNITIPNGVRIQFYNSRVTQLGEEYSASRFDGVYYKREATAPAARTMNSQTVTNTKEDAYMPVSGQIANVYVATGHNHSGSGRINSTQYDFDYATNETNGDYPTAAGGHFGVTVKPQSVNSVFTIKLYSTVYQSSSYAGLGFYCDYIDADPQPNNSRTYKNPNDNSAAKAVFLVGRHMHIDRFKQPEFNSSVNSTTSVSSAAEVFGFSRGQVTPGTWPDTDSTDTVFGVTQQPFTENGSTGDYVTHNDGNNVGGASDDNNYLAGLWHLNAHVHNGIMGVQYFRPGVTDKIRFRLQLYREANTGTASLQYQPGSSTVMVVEEYVYPYGSFGFDIPGGLDTTAHWNGNLV
ncbi:MAG: putative tail fiber protein [Prokaryotic dsDNA virus sp.]|nr:MAG: putative tail fiber protein [Prokaryotic dsDNA virus sp.]|tara:strand:+ start:41258 stop:43387 length:2130 start_codon:yes stop_codon:yes gene_type:complete